MQLSFQIKPLRLLLVLWNARSYYCKEHVGDRIKRFCDPLVYKSDLGTASSYNISILLVK